MNQPYARVNQPYTTLTLASALREMFGVQLYKNNARALLSRILSILNLDWLQHARSVRGVYECYVWPNITVITHGIKFKWNTQQQYKDYFQWETCLQKSSQPMLSGTQYSFIIILTTCTILIWWVTNSAWIWTTKSRIIIYQSGKIIVSGTWAWWRYFITYYYIVCNYPAFMIT